MEVIKLKTLGAMELTVKEVETKPKILIKKKV